MSQYEIREAFKKKNFLKIGPPSPDYNKQAPKGHGYSPSKLSSSGPKSLRPKPNPVQRPN